MWEDPFVLEMTERQRRKRKERTITIVLVVALLLTAGASAAVEYGLVSEAQLPFTIEAERPTKLEKGSLVARGDLG